MRRRRSPSGGDIEWVYGSAMRAASSEGAAAAAATAAIANASSPRRREMMVAAVLHAIRQSPCEELAPLPADARAAIALARFLEMSVGEIAVALERDAGEVKMLMRFGLARLGARSRLSDEARSTAR